MDRNDLEALEAKIMKKLVERRGFGGYDANAETIIGILEMMLEMSRHLRDKEPRPKGAKK